MHFVIADDNEDAAITVGELFRLHGHTVDVAFDGAPAVDLVQRKHPDVVILDLHMPEMDGFEAARAIRSSQEATPLLIALTGSRESDSKLKAAAVGFDEYFTKPVDERSLQRLLAVAERRHKPPDGA